MTNETDNEKVERMAEIVNLAQSRLNAQSRSRRAGTPQGLAKVPEPARQPLEFSLGMLEALQEAGLQVVEREPNAAMVSAGAKAGGISAEAARAIFKAMIKA